MYEYTAFALSIYPSILLYIGEVSPTLTLHMLAKRLICLGFSLLPLENQDPDIQTQVPFPVKTNRGRFPGKHI